MFSLYALIENYINFYNTYNTFELRNNNRIALKVLMISKY